MLYDGEIIIDVPPAELRESPDPRVRDEVDQIHRDFADRVAPRFDRLRMSVIHNDANDYNVLCGPAPIDGSPRRITGLLQVDDVILGCVSPVGEQGANVARVAAMNADYAETVPGKQINRFCASGLEAVNAGASQIMAGQATAVVGGGLESMSRVPMMSDGGAWAIDPQVAYHTYFVPQGIGADEPVGVARGIVEFRFELGAGRLEFGGVRRGTDGDRFAGDEAQARGRQIDRHPAPGVERLVLPPGVQHLTREAAPTGAAA